MKNTTSLMDIKEEYTKIWKHHLMKENMEVKKEHMAKRKLDFLLSNWDVFSPMEDKCFPNKYQQPMDSRIMQLQKKLEFKPGEPLMPYNMHRLIPGANPDHLAGKRFKRILYEVSNDDSAEMEYRSGRHAEIQPEDFRVSSREKLGTRCVGEYSLNQKERPSSPVQSSHVQHSTVGRKHFNDQREPLSRLDPFNRNGAATTVSDRKFKNHRDRDGRSDFNAEDVDPASASNPEVQFDSIQKQFLQDLMSQRARVVKGTHKWTAKDDKQLSLFEGEYFQLLDDSHKWWKAKNSKGQVGHVRRTMVWTVAEGGNFHASASDPQAQFEGQQKMFLEDLISKKAKVVEVLCPRTADKENQISLVQGEFLELLNDKSKKWKVKNSRLDEAYVHRSILRLVSLEDRFQNKTDGTSVNGTKVPFSSPNESSVSKRASRKGHKEPTSLLLPLSASPMHLAPTDKVK